VLQGHRHESLNGDGHAGLFGGRQANASLLEFEQQMEPRASPPAPLKPLVRRIAAGTLLELATYQSPSTCCEEKERKEKVVSVLAFRVAICEMKINLLLAICNQVVRRARI
jgi:hypothetical protein